MENILTPAFVFDITALKKRVAELRTLFGKKIKLCYAIKANPFLVGDLIDVVDYIEVCSPGEYRICERLNIPREKIVLSGVYKERGDIEKIVGQCKDKTTYTIESPAQLQLLSEVAKKNSVVLPVIIRLSSGNQFGVDRATVEKIVGERTNYAVEIEGIQYYSGTQKKTNKILKEIEDLDDFAKKIEEKYDFKVKKLEYGPGLKVNYFTDDKDSTEEQSEVATALNGLKGYDVVIEMGRFIAAYCGEYYTSVVDLKRTENVNYCIVDGGINHLNYYGQMMAMKQPYIKHLPNREKSDKMIEDWTICGSLCTTADVLVRDLKLNSLKIGDVLVFQNIGAYSITEGIYLFLSRDMPRVYKKMGGKLELVRDVIQTDKFNN